MTDPLINIAARANKNPDGSPSQEGIFTNHNDAMSLDVDPQSLVGRSSSTRGPAKRITLGTGLTLINDVLSSTGGGGGGGSPETPMSILTKIKTVDGIGSGLDSDLLDGLESSYFAPIASPAFTGNPTAPTAAPGDNDDQIATTAFVTAAVVAAGSVAPSNTVPNMDGVGAPGSSPLYSRGDHTHPSDTTKANLSHTHPQSEIINLTADLGLKAPLASPTFTGDPKAPTQSPGDNDTSIATTAFVTAAITAAGATGAIIFIQDTPPASAVAGNLWWESDTGELYVYYNDGTSIQWVRAVPQVVIDPATATPIVDGTGAVGTSLKYAREDHVHPTDTTRAPLADPSFTGNPQAPTASPGDSDFTIANTAFVANAISGRQPIDTTLTALAALDSTAGLLEQTGADTFTKRTIGVGTAAAIPTTGDADGRYAALSHTHAASSITGGAALTKTDDANVTLSLGGSHASALLAATSITVGWSGTLGLARGGTNSDLSATGGSNHYLKQASVGAAITVGAIPAADIASGQALTKGDDTNVTLTLGGTPGTALLQGASITAGWNGTLGAVRGGWGADISGQTGIALITSGVASFLASTGTGDVARKDSPVFTGNPTAPTASPGDNDTTIATTAFVTAAVTAAGGVSPSNDNPLMDGTAAPGVSALYSRKDHVHPTDTSRAPLDSPTFTTAANAPTPPALDNDTSIATTAFIQALAAMPNAPTGRLTLISGNPVMNSTQSAKGTMYYTPYKGAVIWLYNGTLWQPKIFSELSNVSTDTTKNPAAVAATTMYDFFVWDDSGTLRLSRGPAWTNLTTRSSGTALTMVNGILMNNAAITNGPAASRGVYVGSARSSGSSLFEFQHATMVDVLGIYVVWNMYNRVKISGQMSVSSFWTYGPGPLGWRYALGTGTYLNVFATGMAEDWIDTSYYIRVYHNPGNSAAGIGIGLDSASPMWAGYSQGISTGEQHTAIVQGHVPPQLGSHYLAALELCEAGTPQFLSYNAYSALTFSLMM